MPLKFRASCLVLAVVLLGFGQTATAFQTPHFQQYEGDTFSPNASFPAVGNRTFLFEGKTCTAERV